MRYGLKNLYRAKLTRTDEGVSYGTPTKMPGAVSMTLTPEGSDPSDFYADDGIYYTIAGTNGGYSAEFVLARLSDEDRKDLLGEEVSGGIQYETTDDEIPEYAYIMEMQGNFSPIAFCFFSGKASRIAMNANTKGESVEVDTDTLSVRFTGVELPFNGDVKSVIQGHLEKTSENEEKFKKFFQEVPVPCATAEGKEPDEDAGDEGGEEDEQVEPQSLVDDYATF